MSSFFLACLLLVGSFIPRNDLSALSKLPQLPGHYRFHHSAAGGGLALRQFLTDQYGAGTKGARSPAAEAPIWSASPLRSCA